MAHFSSFPALKSLTLVGNNLDGTIPGHVFASLQALEDLDLSSNRFSGPIPAEIFHLPRLSVLQLYDNQLTGSIPPALCNMKPLSLLVLSNNQLSGAIPTCMGNLSLMDSLLLDSNYLTGPIPSSFTHMKLLLQLNLSSNFLEGGIPKGLGSLPRLARLRLSHNKLSGRLPEGGADFGPSIWDIALDSNHLTGPAPKIHRIEFEYQPGTVPVAVDISYNYFYGSPLIIQGNTTYCPSIRNGGALHNARNCLDSVPGCSASRQSPPVQCLRFCGTGSKAGQCSGHGTCVVVSGGSGVGCVCDPGFKLAPNTNLYCIKA